MVSESFNHNRVVGNFVSKLGKALIYSQYEVFMSEIKVWIKEKQLFYPDIILVYGKLEFHSDRDDTITNPIIITENYDRVKKFGFYRSIPTFQEYILIDQYRGHIEHFYLESKEKWIFTDYSNEKDILKFNKIDFQISLKDVYDRVEFKKEERSESFRPSL